MRAARLEDRDREAPEVGLVEEAEREPFLRCGLVGSHAFDTARSSAMSAVTSGGSTMRSATASAGDG